MEPLLNRKSTHCFVNREMLENEWNKIQNIIKYWDAQPGPFGNTPRLNFHEKGIGNFLFTNEKGWVIGSHFVSNDKEKLNHTIIDLGYKMYCLSIDLSKKNISTCFCSNLDQEKLMKFGKEIHTMEFQVPLALAFGVENKDPNILRKFLSWFNSDSYRIPISKFVEDPNKTQEFIPLFEAVRRSPSYGNAQNWRILVDKSKIHFYCTSEYDERYLNIGCALGAFEMAAKVNGITGEWNICEEPPKHEGEYIISFTVEQQKNKKK